jgi:trigger factor
LTEPLIITQVPRADHQLDLTIQLGPERTEQALQTAIKQVGRQANIPGFRRGKAPNAAILRAFGRERLLRQVIEKVGQQAYEEAIANEQIEPYGKIEMVDITLDPPTFKMVVPLVPIVDLGDYRSLRLEAPSVNVTEADVETLLDQARTERVTWQEVARPAAIGDIAVMDIRGAVGETTMMDNHDWGLLLKDEEGGWLPGFDAVFVGMAAGDEKTFTLRYPETSLSRFKGQEVTFQATIKQVKAKVKPELNDEFARLLGDYQDLADLRAKLLAWLTVQRIAKADAELDNAAFQALLEQATVAYPPGLLEEMIDEIVEDARREAAKVNQNLEDNLRLQGMKLEDYRARVKPQAEQRLRNRLVLGWLARAEQIEVAPEEITQMSEALAQAAGNEEQAAEARKAFDSEKGRRAIENDLLIAKTRARLRAIVTGQAPELSAPATAPSSAPAMETQ